MTQTLKSYMCIALGTLIIVVIAGDLIFRLACAAFGLYLIWYGMLLRNPSLNTYYVFRSFSDRFQRPW